MANLNKVFLIGNLTRDPELRYTPSGMAVVSFGLATNRRWKGQDGQDREDSTFVEVTAFGRQAEVISEYMSKGTPIFVEGRLKYDQWEDRDTGQKRSMLGVTVENFQFLGSPLGSGSGSSGGKRPQEKAAAGAAPDEDFGPTDDDIPF